jgi:drug/metabolite transporter (DMT)-like permease
MTVSKVTASIAAAAMPWGVSSTASKVLLNLPLDPVFVVRCRATYSFLILLGFWPALGHKHMRVSVSILDPIVGIVAATALLGELLEAIRISGAPAVTSAIGVLQLNAEANGRAE